MSDISKLPKWAQRYIRVLESDNKALLATLNSIEHGTSPVSYHVSPNMERRHLPGDAVVLFGDVQVSHRDGEIEVRTDKGRLVVYPNVANSIRVRAVRLGS